jgi:nitrogen regulatory protein PII
MKVIAEVASTNTKGDGKIYVSNVYEMTDICTKDKEILDFAE